MYKFFTVFNKNFNEPLILYLNIRPRNESSLGLGFSHSTQPMKFEMASVVFTSFVNFDANFVFKLVSPSKLAVITYA